MRGALHLLLAAVPLLGGCFADAPKAPKNWTIEWDRTTVERNERDALPAVKLSQFEVRAPYNGAHLAVLRPDGSIAFDSFNSFAAQPAALLKGAAFDSIEASGVFSRVIAGGSSAVAPYSMEITVTRLALDCRVEPRRDASVALTVVLVGSREVMASAHSEAAVPVADGDFSQAFSAAFAEALVSAVRSLELK